MKQFLLILSFVIPTLTCYGQSLFFDNLKNSSWTSEIVHTDSTIKYAKEISLAKLTNKADPNTNKTIWVFGDVLSIRHYNAKSRCVSDISTHTYIADKDKGLLKIMFPNNLTLTYKTGITSTGNYVLLIRQKE